MSFLKMCVNSIPQKEFWLLLEKFRKSYSPQQVIRSSKFYDAIMKENRLVLKFSNHIHQLASTLKSMSADIPENEMAMGLLNGLPDCINA